MIPVSRNEWMEKRIEELCEGIVQAAPQMHSRAVNAVLIRDWADEIKAIAEDICEQWDSSNARR